MRLLGLGFANVREQKARGLRQKGKSHRIFRCLMSWDAALWRFYWESTPQLSIMLYWHLSEAHLSSCHVKDRALHTYVLFPYKLSSPDIWFEFCRVDSVCIYLRTSLLSSGLWWLNSHAEVWVERVRAGKGGRGTNQFSFDGPFFLLLYLSIISLPPKSKENWGCCYQGKQVDRKDKE